MPLFTYRHWRQRTSQSGAPGAVAPWTGMAEPAPNNEWQGPPLEWYHYLADVVLFLLILAVPVLLVARGSMRLAGSRGGDAFRDGIRRATATYRGSPTGVRIGRDFQATVPPWNATRSRCAGVLVRRPDP